MSSSAASTGDPSTGDPSTPAGRPGARPSALPPRTLLAEVALLLGVSLGASALRSVLAIVNRLTAAVPLGQQTARMNTAVTPDRPWLDLAYQLVGIALAVVPAVLALHLLRRDGVLGRDIGVDARRPARDLAHGAALAAAVGIPGLAFYLLARAAGLNTTVSAAGLADVWWAAPVLVLAAVQNAVLEEVVMIGYVLTRLEQAGWRLRWAVAASAAVRGAYHLYQGFGGFVGNVVMGLFFGWVWSRTRRTMPLVVAHTLLDVVAFVGYAALAGRVSWL